MSASAVISPAHSDSDSEGGGRFFRWKAGTVGRRGFDDCAASTTTGAFSVEGGVPFCRLLGGTVGCRTVLEGGGRSPRSGRRIDCPALAFPGMALAGISGGADAGCFFEGGGPPHALASVRGAFALAPPAQRWAPLAALDAPIKFRLGGGVGDIDGDHVEGILEMETRGEANASLPT